MLIEGVVLLLKFCHFARVSAPPLLNPSYAPVITYTLDLTASKHIPENSRYQCICYIRTLLYLIFHGADIIHTVHVKRVQTSNEKGLYKRGVIRTAKKH